jgi:acetylornithine/N-succinyldiaminopimelate aminotransferase
MARKSVGSLQNVLESEAVKEAATALIEAVREELDSRALSPKSYEKAIRDLERMRGRPLFYPMISGGAGQGARVTLADGSTKLDFIGGIGVYGFGHGDADLLQHAVAAAAQDVLFQGHLMPGPEYWMLSKALLRHAGSRLKHVWLSLSGAVANENALKMIFQKKSPADHVIVFDGGFHGRTLTMAELTDRPAFREGLPERGRVLHVPFFDPEDEQSTEHSLTALEAHLRRHPGRIAGFCFELIQGEGGFRTAPREFFATLMERCRSAGVVVWVDEVQTFARTGELYAFRTLDLEEWVDVVTVGKMLQGSATLVTKELNPKPGLVAGTFAGNTVGMAMGTRIVERLEEEGYLGPEGRIALLGRRIERKFQALEKHLPKAVGPRSGMGAMQAFVPWHGTPELTKAVLEACFEEGLILLSAGANPTKIRMLPPVNTSDEELEAAFSILEKALRRVAEERELPC